jgi:hypothetical protein
MYINPYQLYIEAIGIAAWWDEVFPPYSCHDDRVWNIVSIPILILYSIL